MAEQQPPVSGNENADQLDAVPSAEASTESVENAIDAVADAAASIDQASIDELLKQASFDEPSAVAGGAGIEIPVATSANVEAVENAAIDTDGIQLPNFSQVIQDAQVSSIDLLRDVDLNVKIELGRSRMLVEDVLKLAEGSVVELDKLAGDPVDVFVNDRLVARGEVLVLNDNFCVRINEIVAGIKEEGM
ncbi:MAG: flagellar motor switch protein FliN [Phycisphaerales bacterium]|jgi:flagellar motor switch protein FliN/FliY|nr:flagellar motor switch protein FliN [Phycisphaerales bacterium]